jgi:3-oxoacyl-[acyl-carrier protein] reductase
MTPILKDKVAIITGGGRGIGRVFALRFAEEGAKLFIPDISLERAEGVVKEITAKGGQAAATLTDISDAASVKKMAEKVIQQYGKVDILINNAAIWYGINVTPWDAWKAEDWDRIFSVNVKGTWLCCQAIAPLMVKAGKGKIINIASNVPRVPASHLFLPYACSKGAVYTLTQSLARVLGASGVNVNAIAPGFTASEASLAQTDADKVFQLATSEQSIHNRLQPQDIVETAVFLASPGSDMMTGQTLYVDGGTIML